MNGWTKNLWIGGLSDLEKFRVEWVGFQFGVDFLCIELVINDMWVWMCEWMRNRENKQKEMKAESHWTCTGAINF